MHSQQIAGARNSGNILELIRRELFSAVVKLREGKFGTAGVYVSENGREVMTRKGRR